MLSPSLLPSAPLIVTCYFPSFTHATDAWNPSCGGILAKHAKLGFGLPRTTSGDPYSPHLRTNYFRGPWKIACGVYGPWLGTGGPSCIMGRFGYYTVKLHLEKLLPQSTKAGELHVSHDVLRGLAEVAFRQGRLCKAMDILQKMEEMDQGKDPENVIWSISRKATVANLLGDHEFARELMQKTYEFFALPGADAFLQ